CIRLISLYGLDSW
nr:immunoglobulin heavy chain junction region [Macaca mulatta]